MKELNTINISDSLGMPIKKGVLDFLQQSYQEALEALGRTLVNDFSKITILHGCAHGAIAPGSFTIGSGAVFYNHRIYLVDAQTITIAGGETAVGVINQTQYTDSDAADPIKFTDNIRRNVLDVFKMKIQSGSSGSGIADLGNWLTSATGAWNSYSVPLAKITAFGGGISGTPDAHFNYKIVGKTIKFNFYLSITTTGTTLVFLIDLSDIFSRSFASTSLVLSTAFEDNSFRGALAALINGNDSILRIYKSGGSLPAATYTIGLNAEFNID